MEDKIISFFRNSTKAYSVEEMMSSIGYNDVNDIKEAIKVVNKLEETGFVYCTNKNKYLLFENSNLRRGVLRVNKKGFGFLDIPDTKDDIYVAFEDMNGAIDEDIVIIEVLNNGERKNGKVLKVVSRTRKQFVGEYRTNRKNQGYVFLDENNIKIKIDISKNDSMGAVNGHKVIVKLGKHKHDAFYNGTIIKILGHKDDPRVDILSIVEKHRIEVEFSNGTVEQLKTIPTEVKESEIKNRRDLRNKTIFTIDGASTKDIDDAVCIEMMPNGNYKLGVHIADVSYYVQKDTPLDLDAYSRGTSVYLADTVIPMIPHQLSNGICSLNPDVDRFAVSCDMEFDSKGNVVDYDIYESIIKSKMKMTYDSVNNMLEENIIDEGYAPFENDLRMMFELSKILREMKIRRGYIEFDTNEVKIVQDENGKCIDVVPREQKTGEKLIEDFMIAANETVATHLQHMNLPSVYRIHEKPNPERLKDFVKFTNSIGIKLPIKLEDPHPTDLQKVLNSLRDREDFTILSDLLLRSMSKAVYSTRNIGHFGISSRSYTHFTSPIRRYPDTMIHRLLRTYLFNNDVSNETVNFYNEHLIYVCEQSSERERASVECEREVDDMKKAEYMVSHIGEEYEGIISSVMNFGMFIMLDNYIEGLVRMNDLTGDYYEFNSETMCVVGKTSGKKYKLGQRVKVKVKAASKEERTVDLVIVE